MRTLAARATLLLTLGLLTLPTWSEESKVERKPDSITLKAKLDAWQPRFISACEASFRTKSTPAKATPYCKCSAKKHRQYVKTKAEEEDQFDWDRHLSDLIDMFERPEKFPADNDEPTVVDLDMDLTSKCPGGAK